MRPLQADLERPVSQQAEHHHGGQGVARADGIDDRDVAGRPRLPALASCRENLGATRAIGQQQPPQANVFDKRFSPLARHRFARRQQIQFVAVELNPVGAADVLQNLLAPPPG